MTDLLDFLPDIPRYVEIRAMLLNGDGVCLGSVTRNPLSLVIMDDDGSLAAVIGAPPESAIREAARAKELLAFDDNCEYVASVLADWPHEGATLHELPRDWMPPAIQSGSFDGVRIIDRPISTYSHIPEELAEELRDAEEMKSPIGAAFVDGWPVAFCYAGWVTETRWDVAIDTLEEYRQRGFAAAAALYMIDYWAKARAAPHAPDGPRTQRRPVWGSADSNPPSFRLAAKLGFDPVDRLHVFTRPSEIDLG